MNGTAKQCCIDLIERTSYNSDMHSRLTYTKALNPEIDIEYSGMSSGVEWSFEHALTLIDDPLRECYAMMFKWFIQKTGTVGKQLKRTDLPFPNDSFTPYAQRGIHVPSKQRYAANITVKNKSIYHGADRPLIELPDKTWLLVYSEHRSNTGVQAYDGWNAGLMNNLRDGVPVGVYIEDRDRPSRYYRALAYVEDYNPEHGCFILRGPVAGSMPGKLASPIRERKEQAGRGGDSVEELLEDMRTYEMVRQSIRNGQQRFRQELLEAYGGACAITRCAVPEALQAAHIIGYRGLASNVVTNGLLLRADVHLLYDSGLLTVDPDGLRVVTSRRLAGSGYSELDGARLELPSERRFEPNRDYLAVKFREFEMMDRAS